MTIIAVQKPGSSRNCIEVMSNDQLRIIAAELVTTVRNNSGTDWWQRENVRAKMRVAVKAILRRQATRRI